jgi:hypothetical protein
MLRRDGVDLLLAGGQQIDQQRSQALVMQRIGDKAIPRAESATAATVGKQDHPHGDFRHGEVALDRSKTYINMDGSLAD